MLTMLPPDTDLVLLEFSINDQFDDTIRTETADSKAAVTQHLEMDAQGR